MSWNKHTVDQSGFKKIIGVLDHADVDYEIEELCEIHDRGATHMHKEPPNITLSGITLPGKEGGFHQTVIQYPGPDRNDEVILRKTSQNDLSKCVALIKETHARHQDPREELTVEEINQSEESEKKANTA